MKTFFSGHILIARGLKALCFYLQGYFQALFSCIEEELLRKMNVEKIVLPAAEEAELMWTRKFGFRKITEEEVSAFLFPQISFDFFNNLKNVNFKQVRICKREN